MEFKSASPISPVVGSSSRGGHDWFVLLLAVASALILLILFIPFAGGAEDISPERFTFKKTELGAKEVSSATSQIVTAELRSKGGIQTYDSALSVFGQTASDYLIFGRPNIRELMEDIKSQAQKEFPGEYKPSDFIIPCFDNGCQPLEAEPVVAKVILDIKNLGDGKVDFNAAFMAANKFKYLPYIGVLEKSRQISYYNNAFSSAKQLYLESDKDKSFKSDLAGYLRLINERFPEMYPVFYKVNFYDL